MDKKKKILGGFIRYHNAICVIIEWSAFAVSPQCLTLFGNHHLNRKDTHTHIALQSFPQV